MSVRIQLDNPPAFYTNLDTISGRIILNLTSDEKVTAIVVKLEGESRTALARPPGAQQNLNPSLMNQRDQRQGASVEIHKLLYKTNQVFPSQTPAGVSGSSKTPAYTIRTGEHSYAFQFKIPFNNACSEAHFQNPGSGYAGLQQWQYRHVKKTLPPSLTGFPGKAEIRYFVKVTVQRPGIFRENRRATCGFRFLPIEPPRAPPTTNVVYARRSYSFQPSGSVALKGEVDVQLPSPAVLTCNEPIPLRIVLRKLSEGQEQVYLTSLQMFLIGSTEVSAGDEVEAETSVWTVMSTDGLALPIGRPSDTIHSETVVDKSLWDQTPLPNSIAPSFHTCNLKRKYSLEVRVGLGYGSQGNIQVCAIHPTPIKSSTNINMKWNNPKTSTKPPSPSIPKSKSSPASHPPPPSCTP